MRPAGNPAPRGRFDRGLLPEPESYYCATEGLQFREKRGTWRTTECPWHGGQSLRINLASGAYACMGCGERGGDVIAFAMNRHGLTFVEAARRLGCWVEDGSAIAPPPTRPAGLSAADALALIAADAELLAIEALRVANGHALDQNARQAIADAARRVLLLARPTGERR